MMDREQYFRRWSALHGGVAVEANTVIKSWLSLAYAVALPLTRVGLTANALTYLGIAFSIFVAVCAGMGWLWIAVLVAVIAAFMDNLDGAVAILTGNATRRGYVLDSVADRISDAAFLVALWLAGASGIAVVAAGFLAFLQEYLRARAGAAGVSEVGVVSFAERPTRIIIVTVYLGLAAWAPYGLTGPQWASMGALLLGVVCLIGLIQVGIVLRNRLAE